MSSIESAVLSYLANAVWQLPLLFGAGWLAARALRALGPPAEHRLWAGVLILQAALPALSAIPAEWLRSLFLFAMTSRPNADSRVSVVLGGGTPISGFHLPSWIAGMTAIAYIAFTAYYSVRFAWRLSEIRSLRRQASQVVLAEAIALFWDGCARSFAISNARVATSSKVLGPVAIGIVRPLILFPARMLESLPDPEVRAAIAHEFVHIRRNDYLKNLVYELLSLPMAFHPFYQLTRARLTESREMVCDQIAAEITNQLAKRTGESHPYARSLLRLAALVVESAATRTPHAIGIFDASTFERRVMRLTHNHVVPSVNHRVATIAGCALLGLGICGSALALSVHIDPLAGGEEKNTTSPSGPVSVSPDKMAAQLASKVNPVYPPDAKKARIQGTVRLDATVGKGGEVEQLKVISGPRELQQSSLDAVSKWTYKPFLINGSAVEVKTTISVIYSLRK